MENVFLEGSISLIEKKEKRIVIKDQSILVTPKTSFTNNNSYRPMTFQDLKIGSEIRVNVIYEKGELEASLSINWINKQKEQKMKKIIKNKQQSFLTSNSSLTKNASYLGFTLLELMIVVAILAIIMSIAVPNYRSLWNANQ